MKRTPISLRELEFLAEQVLSPHAWDFISAGAQDETTVLRNRLAFESVTLRSRFLEDVSQRELSTTILGEAISLPVMLAPAGRHQLAHPEGELATARAAAAAGTVLAVATGASYSLEEVARESRGAPLWFQLYHLGRDISEMLVSRAERAGYKAICVTVDIPVGSPIERSVRHGADYPGGSHHGNFLGDHAGFGLVPNTPEALAWTPPPYVPFTWSDLDWIRSVSSLPIVLKGLRTEEDAHRAAAAGVDGIVVSNHGGRQLDGTLSTIEMLPGIVAAVRGRTEVYLDSGIRRGTDVIKALSLGARAVLIGRPLFWGLAWGGAEGVGLVLEILRREIDLGLAHCGYTSVDGLDRSVVDVPIGFGRCTCRANDASSNA